MDIEDVVLGPMRRGIVYGLPFADYCDEPALNATSLKAGFQGKTINVRRIKWAFENERDDTEAMLFGRALHCMMFEPHEFEFRYCAYDGVRNKRHKAFQDFLADHTGAEILKLDGQYSYNAALAAGLAFAACQDVRPFTSAGKGEVTLFSEHQGMQLRARLDWVASCGVLVDMKTSRDVAEEAFGRQFFGLKYDVQLGMYEHMLAELTGTRWPVKVLAVENKPPHEVVVYDVPEAVVDQGWERARAALERVRLAIDTGLWPGVSSGGSVPLFVPPWEMEETVVWDEGEPE